MLNFYEQSQVQLGLLWDGFQDQLTANCFGDHGGGGHKAGVIATDGVGDWYVERRSCLAGARDHHTVVALGGRALAAITTT